MPTPEQDPRTSRPEDRERTEPLYSNAGTIRVLGRAMDLLEALARRPMRPSELCRYLGLPWTSVHRLITHLAAQRFVDKEPDSGRYRVGQACWLVGSAYTVNHPVLEVARPVLELLSTSIDCVLQLSERAGRLALTLFSVHNSKCESVPKTAYGYHLPLHCSSKGQILLAYASSEFIDWYLSQHLEQLTTETLTDPAILREVLHRIREDGYARTEGGVLPFSGSIAVPVFGADAGVTASISATMLRSALADKRTATYIAEQLHNASLSVSTALGWRPVAAEATSFTTSTGCGGSVNLLSSS
jgi:IclR family KDG regulon transcriptional repressor